MPININGRKIHMFRCHLDPCIPPAPANAFCVGQKNIAAAELTPAGVFVTTSKEQLEFLIPYSNVQAIRLAPEPKDEKKAKE